MHAIDSKCQSPLLCRFHNTGSWCKTRWSFKQTNAVLAGNKFLLHFVFKNGLALWPCSLAGILDLYTSG